MEIMGVHSPLGKKRIMVNELILGWNYLCANFIVYFYAYSKNFLGMQAYKIYFSDTWYELEMKPC